MIAAWLRRGRALGAALWPIGLYLVAYDLAGRIPNHWRPAIHGDILARWDQWLGAGTLPHQYLSRSTSLPLDIAAAIPYTLHFVAPILFVWWLWRRGTVAVRAFAWSFLLANLGALLTQLCFPTAPPWFFERHSPIPPTYGILGDAAGLSRIDQWLGIDYFNHLYAMSRVVFGAFPSMHGAWPILMALHAQHYSNWLAGWILIYTGWMWWAAMYLHHHFLVDLLCGVLYVGLAYLAVRRWAWPYARFIITHVNTDGPRGEAIRH
ncbi:MAG: inositol phosphorylceramide synthase [Deltaproteobacteria bacterium]|nr:inositol phosphorylceramide synthase [Deltaproteobacteria bacterium]